MNTLGNFDGIFLEDIIPKSECSKEYYIKYSHDLIKGSIVCGPISVTPDINTAWRYIHKGAISVTRLCPTVLPFIGKPIFISAQPVEILLFSSGKAIKK